MDPHTLTVQLNSLLQAIQLPFILESPVDLTPSLLIAILESILSVRIPIVHSDDGDDRDDVTSTQNRHITTIKIFLGVLETDILQTDVGLSKLDPRLLAVGAWDEVVYVAEVLCWIGEELGLIQPAPAVDEGEGDSPADYLVPLQLQSSSLLSPLPKAPTPSPSSTITFLPPFIETSPPPTPTTTTLLFATDVDDTLGTNITSPLTTSSPLHQLSTSSTRPRESSPNSETNPRARARPPRSQRYSSSFSTPGRDIPPDDSSFTRRKPPIRRTGSISLVDHESELSAFLEHSVLLSTTSSSGPIRTDSISPTPRHVKSKSTFNFTPPSTPSNSIRLSNGEQDWRTLISTSPDHDPRRTYHLLQKRTELMEELLRLRMSRRQPRGS